MKKAFVAEGSKFVIQQLPLEKILGSAEEKMKTVDVNDTRSISNFVWLGAYPFYLAFQVPCEVPIAALGIV